MDVEVVIKRMATMGAEWISCSAAPLDADYRRAAVGGPGVGSVDAPLMQTDAFTTLVISTTLQELESGRGHAVTGGGSLLPMSEVTRQAATTHHSLAVFDRHTGEALYLGRSRCLASAAQRIVLYASDTAVCTP